MCLYFSQHKPKIIIINLHCTIISHSRGEYLACRINSIEYTLIRPLLITDIIKITSPWSTLLDTTIKAKFHQLSTAIAHTLKTTEL